MRDYLARVSTHIRDHFKKDFAAGKQLGDAAPRKEAINTLMDTDVQQLARQAFDRDTLTKSDLDYVQTVVWSLPILRGI